MVRFILFEFCRAEREDYLDFIVFRVDDEKGQGVVLGVRLEVIHEAGCKLLDLVDATELEEKYSSWKDFSLVVST